LDPFLHGAKVPLCFSYPYHVTRTDLLKLLQPDLNDPGHFRQFLYPRPEPRSHPGKLVGDLFSPGCNNFFQPGEGPAEFFVVGLVEAANGF
jgi:hypothetical protein